MWAQSAKTPTEYDGARIAGSLGRAENKLRASVFEVELYNRMVKPLTLIAMILISMLFIFC